MVKRLWSLLLVILLLCVGAVHAQTAAPPLWVTTLDSVWIWHLDGAAPQRVVDQQTMPVFSPDGKQVAFTLWYMTGLEWAADEFNVPNEIWIADAVTGELTQVAAQPSDASQNNYRLYSQPSWSPDSTRLIWSQVTAPANDESIVIYDLANGTQADFVSGLKAEGDVPRVAVDWSRAGIAVDKNVFHTDGSAPDSETIFVYSEQGRLQSRTSLDDAHPGFSYGHVWIADGETMKIGVLYNDGVWLVIDPATGDTALMKGSPELYSPLADIGASVYFGFNAEDKVELWSPQSVAADHIGTLDYLSQLFTAASISPDGAHIAYQAHDILSIWPDRATIAVGGGDYSESIVALNWGPMAWRVRPG